MVMAEATDLLMLYLSMEGVGLASYVMAGYMRTTLRSTEASLKYVIFGAVASALMLYGASPFEGPGGQTAAALDLAPRRLGFLPGAAQHHEVICETSVLIVRVAQQNIQTMQVQIRHQGADHRPLWRTRRRGPAFQPFHDVLIEETPQ